MMDSAARLLCSYVINDRATTAIEYSLIAAAIALAIAPVLMLLGTSVQDMFDKVIAGF